MRLGRCLTTGAGHAGKRRDGDRTLPFHTCFNDRKSCQGGSRGIASRAGNDGRAGRKLFARDLRQAIDRLRQQIDTRVLGVVPRLIDLCVCQTIVCRQINDLHTRRDELRRHRKRCRMGHGEKGDFGLLGDASCVVRLEAQVAYARKRRI